VHQDVDVTALEAQDLRLLLGVELDLLAVEFGNAALVPVVGVLDEADARVRRVLLELPRAGPNNNFIIKPFEYFKRTCNILRYNLH
jgi:hypothetical protein